MKNRTPLIVTSLLALLITAALLIWLFTGNAKHAYTSPTSADQLRGEFESALKAKDAEGIISMFYWQGVSDSFKSEMSNGIRELVKHDWTAVRLAPFPADYQAIIEANGVRYRPSVPVIGWVVVDALPKGNTAQFQYGKNGDTFYLSCNVQEKIAETK
jgi:hypothetical protein